MRWGLVHTWKAFMTFTVTQSQGGKGNGIGCGPSRAQTTNGVSKLDDLDLRVTINGTTKRWSVGSESNVDYAQVLNPPEIDLEKGGDDPSSADTEICDLNGSTQLPLLGQITLCDSIDNPKQTNGTAAVISTRESKEINPEPIRETLRSESDVKVRSMGFGRNKLIPSIVSWTDSDVNSQARPETVEYWKNLFDKFDPEGFGEIPWLDFNIALKSVQFAKAMEPGKLQILEDMAKVDSQNSSALTFQHFVNIMTGKRSRSFKCAVHQRDREVWSGSDYHLLPLDAGPGSRVRDMARLIADEFLTDERDRKYYADHYKCLPPPLFIISVTLIELGVFTYYSVWHGEVSSSGPLPIDSPFVYRPDKRQEVWRFLFYMVLHAGWVHLMFNLLVQLLVGLPLEMVHGSLRIGCVYMAGVLAGSLGTSVFDPDVYLVGASGGVYALLAAHLANVLLNYNNMEFGLVRLLGVFLIASVDVGFAIYDRYAAIPLAEGSTPPISYVAHLTGALAGLTIGLLVLKNFEQKLREQMLWWLALGVYGACTIFAILFNLFHPKYT